MSFRADHVHLAGLTHRFSPGKIVLDAGFQRKVVSIQGAKVLHVVVVNPGHLGAGQQFLLPEVWVKLNINADQAGRKQFFFDYSDRAVVYLNKAPLFAGNNAFLFKGALFRGDIAVQGNALYLDLKKGENELLIAVAERANGWGLIGRWANADGLNMK